CCAARLSEQQRRIRIDIDEDFFDGDLDRADLGDHVRDVTRDDAEAYRHARSIRANAAARDIDERAAMNFKNAKTGYAETRIDAEDAAKGHSRTIRRPITRRPPWTGNAKTGVCASAAASARGRDLPSCALRR